MTDRHLTIAFGPDAHLSVAIDPTTQPVETLLWGLGETLTRVTADGAVEPWLAQDLNNVAPSTWRVTMRENARFWDGSPVTAEDVAASFRANWAAQIATDFMLSKRTELRIVDQRTLELVTPEPIGGVPSALSYHQFIVHKDGGRVMTGAYRPARFEAGKRLVLEPFAGHWDGTPPLARVTVTYEPDPAVRVDALRCGDVDLLYGLQPQTLAEIGNGFDVTSSITNRVHYLQLNLRRPPLDDPYVRRAVSLAIDRKALLRDVLGGHGAVARGTFPENAGVAVEPIQTSDARRAAQVLDDAGWTPGADGIRARGGRRLAFTISSFPQRAEVTPLATAIRDQLRRLSFDVTVDEVPNIGQKTKDRDFDAAMRSINTLISGDPYFVLAITLGRQGRENTGSYVNAEVERLLGQLRTAPDRSQRQELSRRIQAQLRDDVPNAYLLVAPLITVARKGAVRGLAPNPYTQYFISNALSVA